MGDLFAPDFKTEPYWREGVERPDLAAASLPAKIDVLVIGAGYTGLMAARATASHGRSTLVLDAAPFGFGCSSRNGGQVSTSIKPSFAALSGRYDATRAAAIRREGFAALDFIGDLIAKENLDCDWQIAGRFHGAHNPRQYEALGAALRDQPKGLAQPYVMVPRAEQHREIGSDFYHGGCLYPRHAALHPGKYHLGLLRLARAAGAEIVAPCSVEGLTREGDGFVATTKLGRIKARDVLIATNGYTGPGFPWQRRRVIPIGSYIVATETLPPGIADRLLPQNRVISDTRKLVFYYRLSPDRRRLIFGGRVAYRENDPRQSAPRLRRAMAAIFPELAGIGLSHSWMGYVAYTFDTMPHLGRQDGIWYCLGYCGSGVSLATYFGDRIGRQILGRTEGKTALDDLPFPTRPLYGGNPWFLAPAILYYRLRDLLPL